MRVKKFLMAGTLVVIVLAMALSLAGCAPPPETVNETETRQQAAVLKNIVENQPPPDLGGYSREREALIQIVEERNRSTPTWTYRIALDGSLIEVCPSIGFGIPYATQLTAPERMETGGNGSSGYWAVTVPQSEPNSLYSPESANATWVICVINGMQVVQYMEEDVDIRPYRLKADRVEEMYDPSEVPTFSLKMPTDAEVKAKMIEIEKERMELQKALEEGGAPEPTGTDSIGAEE